MSSDEDGAAMAAMMGFSSFASSRPTKKRRTGGPSDHRPAATSSNTTPLGARRSDLPIHPPTASTALPSKPQQPRRAPMALPPPTTAPADEQPNDEAADSDDPEPQYLDTSHAPFTRATPTPPPTEEEAAAQQARIDAIIEAGNAAYAKPQPSDHGDGGMDGHNSSSARHGFRPSLIDNMAPNRGRGSVGDGGYALHPARPRGGGAPGYDRRGGGRGSGGNNPEWYVDYYDHAFNMNPWEKLEQEMGLKSKGVWLARGERAG